jgi:hypothetical protein
MFESMCARAGAFSFRAFWKVSLWPPAVRMANGSFVPLIDQSFAASPSERTLPEHFPLVLEFLFVDFTPGKSLLEDAERAPVGPVSVGMPAAEPAIAEATERPAQCQND